MIVGYKGYIRLVAPEILQGKKVVSTGMKGEISRCRSAALSCSDGFTTALISSGDAGVYGMAGLALEIIEDLNLTETLDVEVIPGIPALAAAAALLGAPLMHDFAVISLSDLLTPWKTITRRIEAAASAGFVLVIYNPRSEKRKRRFDEAVGIMLNHLAPETPVGLVRNAAREGQSVTTTTLADIPAEQVDMLSILIVGNTTTRLIGGRMVTPRGYMEKYRQAGRNRRGPDSVA